jgi:hypothetical protein
MTLPVSGAISFNAINVELGVAGTTTANINQASYRTLAGVPSGTISLSNFYGKSNIIPYGCATYTTAGTYSFVVPTGASKICVVCVGGGGAGWASCCGVSTYAAGGGGALSYTNCVPTTPGETLTVVVGAAGPAATGFGGATGPGGTSSVSRSATILISAEGGRGAPMSPTNPGGQASAGVGAVKNNGGGGGVWGGGGAAGYSGNGGNGGASNLATPGSGGGGGGGGSSTSPYGNRQGGGGGGVGLVVAGASGAGGTSNIRPGGGGSGGTTSIGRIGGAVGGGTGSHYDSSPDVGTAGGVRIIYGGVGKTYPNNSAP